MKSKTCSCCRQTLDVAEFRLRKDSRDGYAYICKGCQSESGKRYRERYASDPEWRAKRQAYTAEYHKRTWAARADIRHLAKIRATYGLEPEEYQALLDAHQGKCAICGGEPSRTVRLHVDHDHKTGRVRGMLCDGCNLGLGKFQESADMLRRALSYLEQHDQALA